MPAFHMAPDAEGKQLYKYQGSSGLCAVSGGGGGPHVAVEVHLRWTCVKDEGSWMGWTDWKGWMDFLRESGETLWTAEGSSWFRLMICKASWVFPEDTQHTSTPLSLDWLTDRAYIRLNHVVQTRWTWCSIQKANNPEHFEAWYQRHCDASVLIQIIFHFARYDLVSLTSQTSQFRLHTNASSRNLSEGKICIKLTQLGFQPSPTVGNFLLLRFCWNILSCVSKSIKTAGLMVIVSIQVLKFFLTHTMRETDKKRCLTTSNWFKVAR